MLLEDDLAMFGITVMYPDGDYRSPESILEELKDLDQALFTMSQQELYDHLLNFFNSCLGE